MKMRVLFLVGFIAGAWGCGGDAVTNPPPPATPIPPPTATPASLRQTPGPAPTPHCSNFKTCQDQPYGQ
jgi:hypothetical protein